MPTVICSGASSVAPTKESTMTAEGQNTHGSRTRSRAAAAEVAGATPASGAVAEDGWFPGCSGIMGSVEGGVGSLILPTLRGPARRLPA